MGRNHFIDHIEKLSKEDAEREIKSIKAKLKKRAHHHGLSFITDFNHLLELFWDNHLPIDVVRHDRSHRSNHWTLPVGSRPVVYSNVMLSYRQMANEVVAEWHLCYPNEYVIEVFPKKMVVRCIQPDRLMGCRRLL